MMNLMLHSLQPAHGAVNFILAQLYVGVNSSYACRVAYAMSTFLGADEVQ